MVTDHASIEEVEKLRKENDDLKNYSEEFTAQCLTQQLQAKVCNNDSIIIQI